MPDNTSRTVPAEPTETIERLWQNHLDRDDRNSPGEYPDMALITFEEFRDAILAVAATPPPPEDQLLAEAVKAIEELLRSSRRFTKATDPFLESRGAGEELDARRDVVAVRAATEVFLERLRAAQQPTEEGGG